MLYRRRIHLPFEKKIEIGSKWIEVMDQSGQPVDPYQAICGKVSDMTSQIVYLEKDNSEFSLFRIVGFHRSSFRTRFKQI